MSAQVLIVQPDPALAARIGELVTAGTPFANVGVVGTPEEGIAVLEHFPDLDLCICELYFPEGDGLAFLAAVRSRFRRARVILVTGYDLSNFSEYTQGLTIFPTPLDEQVFLPTCQDTLATLQGQVFPPFKIGQKRPPDRWGDCYEAYDLGVKRDVFLTVSHSWASLEERAQFRATAALMARAGHPNVEAVYQGGAAEDREFFCREKWDVPSLAEFAATGQGIDSRLAAQILHTIGSVLLFWDSGGFAHTLITAGDVSVSPQGVIKVANCADPREPVTPPGETDLSALAGVVQSLIPAEEQVPPRLIELLNRMQAGPILLAQVVAQAQAIDVDLAPEQQIEVSQEHKIARQVIMVEQKKQKLMQKVMFAVAGLVFLVAAYFVYDRFFSEPPSRQFSEMVAIPAGSYVYQDEVDTMDHTFYMDKYEITWGQYLKFLKAVRWAGTDAAWRDPSQPANKKTDHEPTDWENIFGCIKYHQPYAGEMLTLDHPAFNVDWYDAMAYAKWAGKRLPTEHEWEKAARGKDGFLFPWGNTFSPKANTSAPIPGVSRDQQPLRIHLVVDASPQDVSPYGVYDMAGNVSEWTSDLAPGKIGSIQVAVIRGANFETNSQDHELLTHRNLDFVPDTRKEWLGFRCVSDQPPPPVAK